MSATLSGLIESLSSLKASKRGLEAQVKEINNAIEAVELDIMRAMDGEGVLESASALGKVTLTERVYPRVEDWPKFWDFIYDNRYIHLLEKRPAALAYREMLALGKQVDGVVPSTMRVVSFTASKGI